MNLKNIILAFLLVASSSIFANNKNTSKIEKNAVVNSALASITDTFSVTNMGCHNDQNLIERSLYRLSGVKKVTMLDGKVVVKYDNQKLTEKQIIAAIEATGTCENPNDRIYKAKKQS